MIRRDGLVVLLLLVATAAACAAQRGAAPAPSSSPSSPSSRAREETSPTNDAPILAPSSAATATAPPSTAVGATGDAWSSVLNAEQALAAGASDCANACRALGSMDRATGELCDETGGGDSSRCDDAKTRLLRARDQVRSACGGCPGGPSVDHDAPIPSTPSTPSP